MADALSAPLGKKRTTTAKRRLGFAPDRLPLARIAFGVAAIVILGVAARALLVNDPMGGRPTAEIGVNSTRNANSLAQSVSNSGTATITARPENPAAGATASMVGTEVPAGNPEAIPPGSSGAIAAGLVPDLLEESEHGAIPRISATGETPFDTYAAPLPPAATADSKPKIAIDDT